jgi:hypothetical protein
MILCTVLKRIDIAPAKAPTEFSHSLLDFCTSDLRLRPHMLTKLLDVRLPPMVAHVIRFVLQNLPALLVIVALLVATARRHRGPVTEQFLSWILLLPIGITGLWAGAFHVFFPATAAKLIGWDVSPFQLEVGMADLAIGATAVIAFWRDLNFKAAAVSVASIFLLGDAVGHVKQMVIAGNFAPGNAGVPFYMDITCPVLTIALLVIAKRRSAVHHCCRPRENPVRQDSGTT